MRYNRKKSRQIVVQEGAGSSTRSTRDRSWEVGRAIGYLYQRVGRPETRVPPDNGQAWSEGRAVHGPGQVGLDQLELRQRGAEVLDDLGGDQVRVVEAGGVFKAVVLEPEDVEAELVALKEVVITVGTPAALRVRLGPRRLPVVAVRGVVAGDELVEVGALQGVGLGRRGRECSAAS